MAWFAAPRTDHGRGQWIAVGMGLFLTPIPGEKPAINPLFTIYGGTLIYITSVMRTFTRVQDSIKSKAISTPPLVRHTPGGHVGVWIPYPLSISNKKAGKFPETKGLLPRKIPEVKGVCHRKFYSEKSPGKIPETKDPLQLIFFVYEYNTARLMVI